MLQRVQTVFILFAVLLMVPLVRMPGGDSLGVGWIPFAVRVLSVVSGLLGTFSIFFFKRRSVQLLLNGGCIALDALLIALLVYGLQNLPGGANFPEKGIEPLFPAVAIIFIFIANRFIRKDERLVKSVDRFR
ncbi:MAG: DUF4293 family protein [Bergeyella sp.]|nr:DUF4293 family protein [Bergeyella sp.]